jgi:rhodanese-related sulfurtransferase
LKDYDFKGSYLMAKCTRALELIALEVRCGNMDRSQFLIETLELASLLQSSSPLTLIDSSPSTLSPTLNIPGSKSVQYSNNTLQLLSAIRKAGLGPKDKPIVVYDSSDSDQAGRIWFSLKGLGYKDVKVLNGGLSKWVDEYGSVEEAKRPEESGEAPGNLVFKQSIFKTFKDLARISPTHYNLALTDDIPDLSRLLLTDQMTFKPDILLSQALNFLGIDVLSSNPTFVAGYKAGLLILTLSLLQKADCVIVLPEPSYKATVFYTLAQERRSQSEFESFATETPLEYMSAASRFPSRQPTGNTLASIPPEAVTRSCNFCEMF